MSIVDSTTTDGANSGAFQPLITMQYETVAHTGVQNKPKVSRHNYAWAYLIGSWPVLPDWLALHRGQLEALMNGAVSEQPEDEVKTECRAFHPDDLMIRGANGIAQIPIHGPMIKRVSFFAMLFGFVGTDMIRQTVEHAAKDDSVSSIMLHIESPGGHVAGIHELAQAVKKANDAKPVAAYIDDIGASAAYWVASQAREITANQTAEVGSLGTLAVVPDLSEMAAQQGVKIHVISTGKFKGMGVPGTAIEDEHLQEIQRRVDDVNSFFMRAVRSGRKMTTEQLNEVNDGRVWIAGRAEKLGLIDRVGTFDDAMRGLSRMVTTSRSDETRGRISRQRAALTGMLATGEPHA